MADLAQTDPINPCKTQINDEDIDRGRRHHLPPIVSATLRKLGYAVTAVENEQKAWEAWKQDEYPLLISDWMMPDM